MEKREQTVNLHRKNKIPTYTEIWVLTIKSMITYIERRKYLHIQKNAE